MEVLPTPKYSEKLVANDTQKQDTMIGLVYVQRLQATGTTLVSLLTCRTYMYNVHNKMSK